MKKVPQLNFKTIFSRILFFNLILVVLVTLIPQGVFYSYFKNTYDSEVMKNNMQTVKQTQKSIDELILEKIVDIPNLYLSGTKENDELVYPLYYVIKNDLFRIRNISEKLGSIKLSMPFIDSIEIYYAKSNILIYDSKVCFLDDPGSVKGIDALWLDTLMNTDTNTIWITNKSKESGVNGSATTFVRSIPYFTSKDNRQAIIAVSINKKALYDNIKNIKSDNVGKFLIVDGDGNVVVDNTENSSNNLNIYESTINNVLKMENEGHYEDKIDGKLCVVSFAKSQLNNWIYISTVSIDDFYKKSGQLKRFLIIIGLFMLLTNIIMSLFIVKTAYKPINSIIKTMKGLSKIFGTNESENASGEYKLLSNTINNITFKFDDLNNKLEMNKPIIRYNAILKLLKGKISSTGDINGNEELYVIQFNKERFFCFTLKIYNDKKLSFESEMFIYYNVIELLESKNDLYDIKAVIDESNILAGIVNYRAGSDMGEILQDIQSKIEGLISVPYTICIGNSYNLGHEEISKSYYQALECLKYTFFRTKEKILYYMELNIDSLKDTGSSLKLMSKVEEAIRAGDMTRLMFAIDGLIESVVVGDYTVEFCKNSIMDLVSTIRNTIIALGQDENVLFGYDIREQYKKIENIDEFKVWIHGIADKALVKFDEKKVETNFELEMKVRKNIMDNIYKDISMDYVAEGTGLSPYQLNKIVKSVTGKNFIDYVTEIKLEYAKKLLKEGKYTVKDISNKLGYNSVPYFIRKFKERYGDTPKEHQKKSWIDG